MVEKKIVIPIGYIEARKRPDGKWQLFFRGTRNEVFQGELFKTASDARNYFKVMQIKQDTKRNPKMKTIHLKCGHKISVKTWPSKAGLAKVRHHYKKFHPARMKKMTKKSLATKRKRGLINPKRYKRRIRRCPETRIDAGGILHRCSKPIYHSGGHLLKIVRGKKGLVKNKCKPNPPSTIIYDKLLGIEARKGHGKFAGQNFKHDFRSKTDAQVLGNPDGSLTIRSKKGRRLWKKFNY